MREPDPKFTPAEAEQARAYLREHAGHIQQMMLDRADGKNDDGEQLFLIVDQLNEEDVKERGSGEVGEEMYYVTANEELIVDFWRYLIRTPVLPDMIVSMMFPDGGHRGIGQG